MRLTKYILHCTYLQSYSEGFSVNRLLPLNTTTLMMMIMMIVMILMKWIYSYVALHQNNYNATKMQSYDNYNNVKFRNKQTI